MGTYKGTSKVFETERSENRIARNFTVNVKYGEKVYSAVAGNISQTGIYLETIGFNPEKNEEIEISFFGDSSIYELFGEIRWDRKLSKKSNKDFIIYGMGVKLHSVPVEYLNFVEYQKFL